MQTRIDGSNEWIDSNGWTDNINDKEGIINKAKWIQEDKIDKRSNDTDGTIVTDGSTAKERWNGTDGWQ